MKIYSWNVLRSNRKLPDLYSFVESLDFDVLCLQEVTEEMLTHFKTMPSLHIAYHVDRFAEVIHLFSKNTTEVNYAVILSKHKIIDHHKIQFPNLLATFNSEIFGFCMGLIQKWESITNLGAVYADINFKGEKVRVFSVHLALWNPKTRANEFAHLMEYLPETGPVILCGDLNILEYGPIKILNWFLGSSVGEALPWYSERKPFEERFKQHGLSNPLLGQVTYKFAKSQLDHILVSKEFDVKKAEVIPERHGSDHQPIYLELEFKA